MLWTAAIVIVVLICLAGIGAVVLRKFPQLTMIDVDSMPKERDAKKKKQIAEEKVHRAMSSFGQRVVDVSTIVFTWLRGRFRVAYARLREIERSMTPQQPISKDDISKRLPQLQAEAEIFMKEGNHVEAEKRLIEILRIDRKDADAYWGLGSVLAATKRDAEAAEIFSYLSKLLRRRANCTHDDAGIASSDRPCPASAEVHTDLGAVFVDLGIVRRNAGDLPAAKAAFESSVAFGGDNPRHLDLLLEACILTTDKPRARRVLERLTQANPENQKLSAFEERIAALPDPDPTTKKGKRKIAELEA